MTLLDTTALSSTADHLVLRASTTTAYLDCQLRAASVMMPAVFREHGHTINPPRASVGALWGTAMHSVAEIGLREWMAGKLLPVKELEDAGVQSFDERRALDSAEALEWVMDSDTPTFDVALKQLRASVPAVREGFIRNSSPLAIESRIAIQFRPGVTVSGQADLLALTARDGLHAVEDLKTSRRRMKPIIHMPQIGTYSLLLRSKGHRTDRATIQFLRRGALQPAIESQPLNLTQAEGIAHAVLTEMADKGQAFVKDGNTARFLPNPQSYLCSPKFCRLWGTKACPATFGARLDV